MLRIWFRGVNMAIVVCAVGFVGLPRSQCSVSSGLLAGVHKLLPILGQRVKVAGLSGKAIRGKQIRHAASLLGSGLQRHTRPCP
jgi:hypothetical protein